MLAILTEHYAGKWPFWLSPRQIIIIPLSEKANDYCEQVYKYFHKKGYECDVDRLSCKISSKIRSA